MPSRKQKSCSIFHVVGVGERLIYGGVTHENASSSFCVFHFIFSDFVRLCRQRRSSKRLSISPVCLLDGYWLCYNRTDKGVNCPPHVNIISTAVPPSSHFNEKEIKLLNPTKDPIKLELYKNMLTSVAEEMGVTLQRTAFSPNIKERPRFFVRCF